MKSYNKFSPSLNDFEQLKDKIVNGTENQCRDSLIPFSKILSYSHNISLEQAFTEYNTSGEGKRVDLILTGAIFSSECMIPEPDRHYVDKKIVIYECKSPQSLIFKNHNKNGRIIPSEDLIEAETQLFDYASKPNYEEWRNRIGGTNQKVIIGGIIIGRKPTEQPLVTAYRLRQQFLYEEAKIKIFTWDEIINLIGERYTSFA